MLRLTLEQVQQAIKELQSQGQNPTNQRIVNWVGYGSFSTLTKWRKSFPEVFGLPQTRSVNQSISKKTRRNKALVLEELSPSVLKQIEAMVSKQVQIVFEKYHQEKTSVETVIEEPSPPESKEWQEQVEQLKAQVEQLQTENEALRQEIQQIDALKSEMEALQSEKETLSQPIQQVERVEPLSENQTLPQPTQILENYRALIQQKRAEIEDSKILQTPDWRTKKARWPKLVDFLLELEQIEPNHCTYGSTTSENTVHFKPTVETPAPVE